MLSCKLLKSIHGFSDFFTGQAQVNLSGRDVGMAKYNPEGFKIFCLPVELGCKTVPQAVWRYVLINPCFGNVSFYSKANVSGTNLATF